MVLIPLLIMILFMASTVTIMLGPILVPLAADLHTSVAIAGQLATVTSLVWGFTAFGVGPLSDTYGRRLVLLTGLLLMGFGLAGSALVNNYASLIAARMLTGFAGAMIVPTCYVACADHVSPAHRGRGVAWAIAGASLGMGAGMPLVAWLVSLGSWRTPFWVFCVVLFMLWTCIYAVFPRHVAKPGHTPGFLSHFREASAHGRPFWLLLTVNLLLCVAFFGLLPYLPAFLMQSYRLTTHETVLPLVLTSAGVLGGSILGGPLATFPKRATVVVSVLALGGVLTALAFCVSVSLWVSAVLACFAGGLFVLSQPLILTQLITLSGRASGTATGFFALSSQLGAMGGTGLGGVLLSFGGYSHLGLGCLGAALIAAFVMTRTTFDLPAALH